MRNTATGLIIFGLSFLSSLNLFAQNDKMSWWREARFGMFIHWGVYSVYGNVYDGVDVNGNQVHYDNRTSGIPSEWIMNGAKIPRAVYREAAKEFDAKEYDPKKWVEIAKNAGMKYIVITAKHHDGFCLFDTDYTDWNAVNASAAKRDLLKELVDEAKAAGLKIGFYYSQNADWMAEGGMGNIPELNGGEYPLNKVEAYVDKLVIPQIKELTTNYDIDIFWFDAPGVNNSNNAISQRILNALLNSPLGTKIVYNDRLYPGFEGHYSTPETDTPAIPYNGDENNRDWEACASLNTSWGFEHEPEPETVWTLLRWNSGFYTISRILELSSKGGNFLLNVGPDQHGNIPERSLEILEEVGEWMKIYGETVYGTQKNELLNPFEYGYLTQKNRTDGSVHWYLHVSPAYWEEKEIILTGVTELPVSAVLFETNSPLEAKLRDNDLVISLPDEYPNPYYSTIDLHFAKIPVQVLKPALRNNRIWLTPFQAKTTGVKKDFIPYSFKFWYRKSDLIEYNICLEAGIYSLESEYASWHEGGEIYIQVNDKEYTGYYKNTGNSQIPNDMNNYVIDDLGGIKIVVPETGKYTIRITRSAEIPNTTNWINVRNFVLKKEATAINNTLPDGLLFPNPVRDGYFICNLSEGQTIRIYDFSGRCRKNCVINASKIINASDLPAGIYIIRGDRIKEKVIVQ